MSRKGIPLIEDREAVLSERVTVKMTPDNRRGLQWLIEQRLAAAGGPDSGLELTEAAYLRTLLTRELRAAGWPGASPPAAEPQSSPPALQASAPVTTKDALAGLERPDLADLKADVVRVLLERCIGDGLTMGEVATLSGIDRARLSHFKNETPKRGELTADKLRTLASALTRWQAEQAKGVR